MNLTTNFSLHELTKSEAALRHNMPNEPGPTEIASLTLLTQQVLQPVRDHYGKGVKVNSGYRHPAVNVKVGGSKTSDHCLGMAADIEIPGVPNHELAEYIAKNYKFTQVILEFYTRGIPDSGWVHVSYDPKNLKCETLTAVKPNGKPDEKTVYLPGLHA